MKIRYSLLSSIALPLAAFRIWQLINIIDWRTGFSSRDIVQQIIDIVLFLFPLLLIPVLYNQCRKHGLAADGYSYSFLSRLFFLICAVALGGYLFLRFREGMPDMAAKKVLFVLTCLMQLLCIFRFLLNSLLGKDLPPLSNSLTGSFPALYFALELLQRFFNNISNPYDTTSDISFFSAILLSLSALKLLQYGTNLSEKRQRAYLGVSLVCFMICMAWRLPTVMIYLESGDLLNIVQVCGDALCAIAYYLCAMDVIGEEY